MSESMKLGDLLKPETFQEHKEELLAYFRKGGTWHALLGYTDEVMEGYYAKAYALYQGADYQNANTAFFYLTTLNPYEYRYWMGLGLTQQRQGSYEEALVSYTCAEAVDPTHPMPHFHLAQCYHALQGNEPALKEIEEVLALTAEKAEAYADLRKQATQIRTLLEGR